MCALPGLPGLSSSSSLASWPSWPSFRLFLPPGLLGLPFGFSLDSLSAEKKTPKNRNQAICRYGRMTGKKRYAPEFNQKTNPAYYFSGKGWRILGRTFSVSGTSWRILGRKLHMLGLMLDPKKQKSSNACLFWGNSCRFLGNSCIFLGNSCLLLGRTF